MTGTCSGCGKRKPIKVPSRMECVTCQVRRWRRNPENRKRDNVASRRWKEENRGVCEGCGAEIWHDSTRCVACSGKAQTIWTQKAIIAAIQRWAHEHGRPPGARDWMGAKDGDFPAARTVQYHFDGSWADAIEVAGFPRPRVGHYDRMKKAA